jgi:hypothetical protein
VFKLPDLPTPWYKAMQEMRNTLGISQWQFFILGIMCVAHVAKTDLDWLKETANEVKSSNPGKWKAPVEES